jgi:chromosome partitioning protein
MLTIALASLSGGQGKTTTALFLGKLLSAKGYKVLMIDADPQASLTFYLGHEVQPDDFTLLEVITGEAKPHQATFQVQDSNTFLIPSDNGLNAAQEHIVRLGAGAAVLGKRLKPIFNDFDVCIIDAPPQGSQLSLASIAAADQLLIPAEAGSKGVNSVLRTLEVVYDLQALEIFTGEILGIVPFRDKWFGRSQTGCSKAAIEGIKKVSENLTVWPSIPESEAFRKSLDQGKLPQDFNPEITYSLEQIVKTLEEKCLNRNLMPLTA